MSREAPTKDEVLRLRRVITYDLGRDNFDRVFWSEAEALSAVDHVGARLTNMYYIDRINGTWTTEPAWRPL